MERAVFNKRNIKLAGDWIAEIDRTKEVLSTFNTLHSNEYCAYLKKYIKKLCLGFDSRFNGANGRGKNYAIYLDNTTHINKSIEGVDILINNILIECQTLPNQTNYLISEVIKGLNEIIGDHKYHVAFEAPFSTNKMVQPITNRLAGIWMTKKIYDIERMLVELLSNYDVIYGLNSVKSELYAEHYKNHISE